MLESKAKGIVENAAACTQQAVKELSKLVIDGEGDIDCNNCYRATKGAYFALISIRDTLADLANENYEPGFEDNETGLYEESCRED